MSNPSASPSVSPRPGPHNGHWAPNGSSFVYYDDDDNVYADCPPPNRAPLFGGVVGVLAVIAALASIVLVYVLFRQSKRVAAFFGIDTDSIHTELSKVEGVQAQISEEYKQELDKLRAANKALVREREDMRTQAERSTVLLRALRDDTDQAKARATREAAARLDLQAQLESMNIGWKARAEELAAAHRADEERLAAMQAGQESSRDMDARLTAALEMARSEAAREANARRELQSQVDGLHAECAVKAEELANVARQADAALSLTVQAAQAEAEKDKSVTEALRRELEQARGDLDELHAKTDALGLDLSTCRMDVARERATVVVLQAELDAMKGVEMSRIKDSKAKEAEEEKWRLEKERRFKTEKLPNYAGGGTVTYGGRTIGVRVVKDDGPAAATSSSDAKSAGGRK